MKPIYGHKSVLHGAVKKCHSHQKYCGGMCCSAASLRTKVTCISVWLYCIGSLLYNALELQVRMKFGVVTEVSTFLVITQVKKIAYSHL